MKQFKLLILLLVIGFVGEAQINYLPIKSRYKLIAGLFDSTLHIPSGTTPSLRTGGHTGSGALFYRTSDSTVYVYTGTQWVSVKGSGGGGSADSTVFATLYRLDTAKVAIRLSIAGKLNISDTAALVAGYTRLQRFTDSLAAHTTRFNGVTSSLATKLNISDTANMRPRLYAGSNVTITGTYPNLTIASTGGGSSDTSTFIVDTTFNRLAYAISDDSLWLKSARVQLNGSDITPTTTDSTISWNIQALVAADTTNKYVTSVYRKAASDSVFYVKGGTHTFAFKDSIGSGGGGGSPAGNYGNVQLNRNGAFATPASDSLNFSGGLSIKGTLSATALPTGGVAADSVVVINSSGALKKRNAAAFVTTNGTTTAGQLALVNGTGTIYSSSKFVYSDATYPSFSIVGSEPLMYFGGTGAAYPSFGKSGNSAVIYAPSSGKSIGFYDQSVGGKQMLRLYTTSGSVAVFNKTAITLDTAVGGPSIGSIHVEYNAGDSTSAATDVGRHMFRGIGRTYANSGSFNTFYSTVEAGNTTYSQDHIIAWQSDAKKTGANTLGIIYHLGILGDSIKAGTVNNRWGVYMYDAKVTSGATLAHQTALRVPKLAAGVRNFDMFSDSAQTVKMDGNILLGDSSLATSARKTLHIFNGTAPSSNISGSILYSESGELKVRNSAGAINLLSGNAVFSGTLATADPGSGSGSWKLGVAVTTSGLTLSTTTYVEISIGGTVYRLAVVDPPQP